MGAYEAIGSGARNTSSNELVRDAQRLERRLRDRRYPSLRIETHVLAEEDHLTVAPRGATVGLLWALPGRGPYSGG